MHTAWQWNFEAVTLTMHVLLNLLRAMSVMDLTMPAVVICQGPLRAVAIAATKDWLSELAIDTR